MIKIQQIGECSLCNKEFSIGDNRASVITVCGDVFCLSCIKKLLGTKPRARCPNCNTSFKTSQHIPIHIPIKTTTVQAAGSSAQIDEYKRRNEKLNRQRKQINELEKENKKIKIQKSEMISQFEQSINLLENEFKKSKHNHSTVISDSVRLMVDNMNLKMQLSKAKEAQAFQLSMIALATMNTSARTPLKVFPSFPFLVPGLSTIF